ncbi:hypothetical protein ACTXT7_014790 [Hymenolepis weldensis]
MIGMKSEYQKPKRRDDNAHRRLRNPRLLKAKYDDRHVDVRKTSHIPITEGKKGAGQLLPIRPHADLPSDANNSST